MRNDPIASPVADPEAGRQAARSAAARAGLSTGEFTRRLLILFALGGLAALLWTVSNVLLIGFGAIMFAVLLSAAGNALHRRAGLPRGLAIAIVALLLVLLTAAVFVLFGSRIATQLGQLASTIPASLTRLRQALADTVWGQRLIDELQNANFAAAGGSALARAFGAVTSMLNVVIDGLLIFFAGLYLAAQPDLYRRGLLSLLPWENRRRGAEVLDALYEALRHWLQGQLVSMLIVGVLFAVALSIIGVPSALVLGVIAALAEFIPLLGPVLATIPAMLSALPQGVVQVAWVVLAFLVIQQTESNLVVPYVQRRAVHLPPVVALFATVVFGLVFGVAGLLFAVPLAVSIMVAVRMIYVEDILGGGVAEDPA